MNIVKAEILWTRTCPLSCSYCAMVTDERNSVYLPEWKKGFDNLKQLGCSFAAFYGAEPLYDFDKLPETIQYAEGLGIHTTVITSGVVSDLYNKLKVLYEHGLRSITASYDPVSDDRSSQLKSEKAKKVIDTFRSFGPVRDAAIVVTLTRKNYQVLPELILEMSKENIWTFFDLIHPDRGQPGSKVKNTEDYNGNIRDLYFKQEDMSGLVDTLSLIVDLKQDGLLCHASRQFMNTVKIAGAYFQRTDVTPFLWNCSDYECFPSWVTVGCSGTVYPCDDFYTKDAPIIKVWELANNWKRFEDIWKPIIKEKCPGCLWNTHIDAHLIKNGTLPLTDYIHGTETV